MGMVENINKLILAFNFVSFVLARAQLNLYK